MKKEVKEILTNMDKAPIESFCLKEEIKDSYKNDNKSINAAINYWIDAIAYKDLTEEQIEYVRKSLFFELKRYLDTSKGNKCYLTIKLDDINLGGLNIKMEDIFKKIGIDVSDFPMRQSMYVDKNCVRVFNKSLSANSSFDLNGRIIYPTMNDKLDNLISDIWAEFAYEYKYCTYKEVLEAEYNTIDSDDEKIKDLPIKYITDFIETSRLTGQNLVAVSSVSEPMDTHIVNYNDMLDNIVKEFKNMPVTKKYRTKSHQSGLLLQISRNEFKAIVDSAKSLSSDDEQMELKLESNE